MSLSRFLSLYWFLILLVVAIILGTLAPNAAHVVRSSGFVIPTLVGVTLFISGFTLDTGRLIQQATNFRAIALATTATYLVAPLAAYLLAGLWAPASVEKSQHFLPALMIMAAQASTLATSIALTMVAAGNKELALILTLASSLLTVVLTPIILDVSLGAVVAFDTSQMIRDIGLAVALPVFLGQIARRFLWNLAAPLKRPLRVVPQLIILVFVYTGFASAATKLQQEPELAALFFGACASLHVLLLTWNFSAALLFKLPASDRTALVFCGSQKTLPNGILVWTKFFPANPYGAVPLVLYHLCQLVIDTLLVPLFEKQNAGSSTPPRQTS